jgi:hypothetical protein
LSLQGHWSARGWHFCSYGAFWVAELHVRFWHKADMAIALIDVRFRE